MKQFILLALLGLTSFAGVAAEWKIFDKVNYRDEFAVICHFWNATIFAPGEKPSCFIGTVYAADLINREIYYALNGEVQGMPRSSSELELKRSVLINSLKGEGGQRLESLRAAQIAANDTAKEKAAAEGARTAYLGAYEAATTLEQIKDFEARYAGNDPDGLIQKLAIHRYTLEYKKYLDVFSNAKTQSDFSRFISAYEQDDRDNLIPEAKRRLAATLQADEKIRQAKVVEAQETIKATAATEAENRKAYPSAWLCKPYSTAHFNGGWIYGAAGNGFINPVQFLDSFITKSAAEKQRLIKEYPLTVRFGRSGDDGCMGVSYFEGRPVIVAEPIGGGKIRGGKFLVVSTELKTQRGLNATCHIVVQSKDVNCN